MFRQGTDLPIPGRPFLSADAITILSHLPTTEIQRAIRNASGQQDSRAPGVRAPSSQLPPPSSTSLSQPRAHFAKLARCLRERRASDGCPRPAPNCSGRNVPCRFEQDLLSARAPPPASAARRRPARTRTQKTGLRLQDYLSVPGGEPGAGRRVPGTLFDVPVRARGAREILRDGGWELQQDRGEGYKTRARARDGRRSSPKVDDRRCDHDQLFCASGHCGLTFLVVAPDPAWGTYRQSVSKSVGGWAELPNSRN